MADIEKFDPATLMQGVKDRIKATFVSLIPDEQWEEMCKTEIQKYFATDKNNYYSSREQSNFTATVFSVLNEEVSRKIKETLNLPEFQIDYKPNSHGSASSTISEAIKSEIVKKAPEIFAASIENMVANAIINMRNR